MADKGELLRQDVFSVWNLKRDHRSLRDLRFKSQTRHIMLYNRFVVLCKKKDDATSYTNKQSTYALKNLIPVRSFISDLLVFLVGILYHCELADNGNTWTKAQLLSIAPLNM